MKGPQPSMLSPSSALEAFRKVRKTTTSLCQPLESEDYVIQSMPDVSPPKWHLAHTSWFFETFLLQPALAKDYKIFHSKFNYLFNSYYKAVGKHHPRPQRGLISRPSTSEIYSYRSHVDKGMEKFLSGDSLWKQYGNLVELGLHHEQQHQELLLTDIKHIFFSNPLRPVYRKRDFTQGKGILPILWKEFSEGLEKIGHESKGFAFDNEYPRHRVFLESYRLGSRLITNGEYLEFIEDGGYKNALLWLSDGWNKVLEEKWEAPLYWEKREGIWYSMTLSGMRPVNPQEPVCHVSFFEADAYARWAGRRLPSEGEWENAAASLPVQGNFQENGIFHPLPFKRKEEAGLSQMYGDVWEWTQSPYTPYPGFKPAQGAVGEYNGKFMCNQMVLKGGSCFSPQNHIRPSYRNFFYPEDRWQCSGIRLAEDF